MSKTLDDIRTEIDSIDNQIHDLLMDRASLASAIAAAKKEDGAQIVHPAREAHMIRRLLGRHTGPLPAQTVIRVWRELIGANWLLQADISVAVAQSGSDTYWDMAKNYFGSIVPAYAVKDAHAAIRDVMDDKASFAVLPWPELDQNAPWWVHLFNRQGDKKSQSLSIIGALPYETADSAPSGVVNRALIASKMSFMPSGDDHSFIGLELNADLSRARIRDKAEQAGLHLIHMFSDSNTYNQDTKQYFLHVEGYVDMAEHSALKQLKDSLGKDCYYCGVIGGYPVIPDITQPLGIQNDAA